MKIQSVIGKRLTWKSVATVAGGVASIVAAAFTVMGYFKTPEPKIAYQAGDAGSAVAKNNSIARGGDGGAACDLGNGGRGGDAYADNSSQAYGGQGGEGACSSRPARGGRAYIPDNLKNMRLPDGRALADVGKGGDGGFREKR